MPGRELSPPGRDDEPTGVPEGAPTLPATVAATHLAACAAELAAGTTPAAIPVGVADLGELVAVIEDLVAGQRHIATALDRLAGHFAGRPERGALALVSSPDLHALAEVLGAAASASGHAAGALAQTAPVFDIVLGAVGPDTPLS